MPTRAAIVFVAVRAAVLALLFAVLWMAGSTKARSQTASPSAASETWVCVEPGRPLRAGYPPLELSLEGDLVIEQPLGATRYRLIANTAHAVIAVDDYADFDPALGQVSIFASTLVLDRLTGAFAITTTTLSDTPPTHRTGRCRVFDTRPPGDRTIARKAP
jgi:hypothetical protein